MTHALHAYVCSLCGGIAITRDAWAEWDAVAQQWVLGPMFDFAYCHHCHHQCELRQVDIDPMDAMAHTRRRKRPSPARPDGPHGRG